jgi:putative oxidoreductase
MTSTRLFSNLVQSYAMFGRGMSFAQSPFLLLVRLYWGWQFAQTGWGKLHNLPQITQFFASLHLPFPAFTAQLVAGVEFVGGILLVLGLLSRFTGLVLSINMFVAYWTVDHEALTSIFSNPGKFYVADPYTFLFASLVVLIFGAGLFSMDRIIASRLASWASRPQPSKGADAKRVPSSVTARPPTPPC